MRARRQNRNKASPRPRLANTVSAASGDCVSAKPTAAPMNGAVQGVATITANSNAMIDTTASSRYNGQALRPYSWIATNVVTGTTDCTPDWGSGGGGGWGDPFERDVERVLSDVRAGFVSAAAARRDYGVAIEDGRVDQAATRALRAAWPSLLAIAIRERPPVSGPGPAPA